MIKGSVIVDVSIDQGGITEGAQPTTYTNPTYLVDEIIHYCVANMPSSVARTTTEALKIESIKRGLNTFEGKITNTAVAEAFDM